MLLSANVQKNHPAILMTPGERGIELFQATKFGGSFYMTISYIPGGLDSKESACSVGDLGSIPGSGRFPGEGTGNPLQYSSLENFMDRRTWWATVWGHRKSDKTDQLTHTQHTTTKAYPSSGL